MKPIDVLRTFTWLSTGLLLLAWCLLAAAPALAQALIANGDFETGTTGWTAFGASPIGRDGGRAGQAVHWRSDSFAGVYQQVPVTPGTTVRLTAWTRAWSGASADTLVDEAWVRQRIGIDPFGGTDPNSTAIQWSLPAQFVGEWGQLAVEAEAGSEHITVFLAAHPDKERNFNDTYYDDVALELVAYPVPTVVAAPAPTVDPLLVGLVEGMGVAPGSQGFRAQGGPAAGSHFAPVLIILVLVLALLIFHQSFSQKRFIKHDQ